MDRSAGQWFVLHVLSGHEKKVRENIESALKKEEVAQPVYEISIPEEKVKDFKKKGSGKNYHMRKLFPGYIYVRMDLYNPDGSLNEKAWYFIRGVQGVISFVGGTDRPSCLSPSEVENLLRQIDSPEKDTAVAGQPPVGIGEIGIINDGPFSGVSGKVVNIDAERGKLELDVSIFGRSTKVEADFWQVERKQD